jgi:hypothetical protein
VTIPTGAGTASPGEQDVSWGARSASNIDFLLPEGSFLPGR